MLGQELAQPRDIARVDGRDDRVSDLGRLRSLLPARLDVGVGPPGGEAAVPGGQPGSTSDSVIPRASAAACKYLVNDAGSPGHVVKSSASSATWSARRRCLITPVSSIQRQLPQVLRGREPADDVISQLPSISLPLVLHGRAPGHVSRLAQRAEGGAQLFREEPGSSQAAK